jgi:NAD(P)-dependent dehydrogenase (short-subunit alcohol dehydrogenase family)
MSDENEARAFREDLHGRSFVVTGANSGLGPVTTRGLAAAGGQVIMACRNIEKGEALARKIGANVEVCGLDLADLRSVREFAASITAVDSP